jgi:hypothetical protein
MHTDVGALRPSDAALRARRSDIELSAPVHVSVTSAYALYIPIAGGVAPEQVVARLRLVAQAIGADDVVDIETSTSCDRGISILRYVAGWVTTEAHGTAVRYRRPAQ